jgi:tetrahydromethanopterin S-methyltransferase subunit G
LGSNLKWQFEFYYLTDSKNYCEPTIINTDISEQLEFNSEEVFERISKAETDDLRVLYEIVFGAKEVLSWFRRRILRFDGFVFAAGSPVYNSLEEIIYRYDSRNLRFVSWLLNVETNGTAEVLCKEICSSLCRRSAVETVSVYRSVHGCNERSMEIQAGKLNVERRMALLQKEEIENRKKILELELALKENEEIKSISNAARVHFWLEGRSNNSVAGGQWLFSGMDKTQSQYHSDRDLEKLSTRS